MVVTSNCRGREGGRLARGKLKRPVGRHVPLRPAEVVMIGNMRRGYRLPGAQQREEAARIRPVARGTYEFRGLAPLLTTPRRNLVFAVVMLAIGFWNMAAGVVYLLELPLPALARRLLPPPGTSNGVPPPRVEPWICLVCLLAGAGLITIIWMRFLRQPARRVIWDEAGVHVARLFGQQAAFGWDDLAGLDDVTSPFGSEGYGHPFIGWVVVPRHGRSFGIYKQGPGFADLSDALKHHIWGRGLTDAVAGGPPGRTECKWCGEALAAGTKACPACGRPVPREG